MSKQVIIIGTGGHAKVVADIVIKSNDKIIGFLDDNASEGVWGYPLLGHCDDIPQWIDRAEFIVAIGKANVRERIMNQYTCNWYTAIHPNAVVGNHVAIGEGSAFMAGTVVNSDTSIGRGCIINTGATVDHDNIINEFSHISVGAHLGGTVSIGCKTWVGIGATVSNNINICDNCTIGAGAVVVKNIAEAGTYVGVPVKRMRE